MTALQEATPIDLQARVVGLLESLIAAMPGVGFLARRRRSRRSPVPATAYAVAGIGVLVLVLAALVLRRFVSVDSTPPQASKPIGFVVPEPTRRAPDPVDT